MSDQLRASRGKAAAILAGALSLLALLAPAAQATYDPVGSGTTKLTFSKEFIGLLHRNGVKLSAKAPVKLKGGAVVFPVAGGKLDPVNVKGTVEHEGALVFQAAGHTLPLKALTLKTTRVRSPLSAKFGGGQLKLSESSKLSTQRQGFGLSATVAKMTLGAKVAERLDKKLGLRGVFEPGQQLGTSLTKVEPASVAIKAGGVADLELAPGFAAHLNALFVALNPIFPAEHLGAPFSFQIIGGQMAPDAASGTLELAGSLEAIQQGQGQAFLRDPLADLGAHTTSVELDLEPSPPNAGKLGRVPVFDLGPGAPSANPGARTITVAGAALSLQAATAQAFNEAFAKPQGKANVFVAGEAFGTLSFSAKAE